MTGEENPRAREDAPVSGDDAPVSEGASPMSGKDAPVSEREPPVTEHPSASLLRRLRTARRAMTVIRGYSAVGLVLAVVLGALSFFYYQSEIPRWICRLGAMGSLIGAVTGLNVMDRLLRGKALPVGIVAAGLALGAVALVAVGVSALRYELGAAWSPLVSATYVFVLVRIMLRIRTPNQEA